MQGRVQISAHQFRQGALKARAGERSWRNGVDGVIAIGRKNAEVSQHCCQYYGKYQITNNIRFTPNVPHHFFFRVAISIFIFFPFSSVIDILTIVSFGFISRCTLAGLFILSRMAPRRTIVLSVPSNISSSVSILHSKLFLKSLKIFFSRTSILKTAVIQAMMKISAKADVTIPVTAIPTDAPPSTACLHDMQPSTRATTAIGKKAIPTHGIILNITATIPQTIEAMPNPRPFCFFPVSIVIHFLFKTDIKTKAVGECYSLGGIILIFLRDADT